jgi:uncharacterized protein YecT (DUF1311 family)
MVTCDDGISLLPRLLRQAGIVVRLIMDLRLKLTVPVTTRVTDVLKEERKIIKRRNIMKKIMALALILFVFMLPSGAASAEESEKHPIDIELEQRLEADYSTAGMIEATSDAAEKWDKLLNANYNALMKKLDKNLQNKLRASQREWIKYRDLEFDFNGSFWIGFEGTMYRVIAASDKCEFVKKRALELGSYLESLDEM